MTNSQIQKAKPEFPPAFFLGPPLVRSLFAVVLPQFFHSSITNGILFHAGFKARFLRFLPGASRCPCQVKKAENGLIRLPGAF